MAKIKVQEKVKDLFKLLAEVESLITSQPDALDNRL